MGAEGERQVEISIVVPCYNEEESLPELYRRVSAVARSVNRRYELILVDDGSADRTWQEIAARAKDDALASALDGGVLAGGSAAAGRAALGPRAGRLLRLPASALAARLVGRAAKSARAAALMAEMKLRPVSCCSALALGEADGRAVAHDGRGGRGGGPLVGSTFISAFTVNGMGSSRGPGSGMVA